ncbi:MAG: hypothetical protein M3Y17_04430 [Actinomycetota bacterium]|nr:hypothetical protein [Actinomycetota bacterium]
MARGRRGVRSVVGELEERLLINSRDLYRRLLDEHLAYRAEREVRISDVRDAGGSAATSRAGIDGGL